MFFPDLTERLALRLSSIPTYTARAHFGAWHKKMGAPDLADPSAIFTPLVVVELEVTDVPVTPFQPFLVRGETYLAKTVDGDGAVRQLVREGRQRCTPRRALVAQPTSATSSPATIPIPRAAASPVAASMAGGHAPSRVTSLLDMDALVPADRRRISPTIASTSGTTGRPTPTGT